MNLPPPGSEVSDDYFPSEVEVKPHPAPPPPPTPAASPPASNSQGDNSTSHQIKGGVHNSSVSGELPQHNTSTPPSQPSEDQHDPRAPPGTPQGSHASVVKELHPPASSAPSDVRGSSATDANVNAQGSPRRTADSIVSDSIVSEQRSAGKMPELLEAQRGVIIASVTQTPPLESDVIATSSSSLSSIAGTIDDVDSTGFVLLTYTSRFLSFVWDYKLQALTTIATQYLQGYSELAMEIAESSQAFIADPPPLLETVSRVKAAATESFRFESFLVLALLVCIACTRLMSLRFVKYERALEDTAKKQHIAADVIRRSTRRSASPHTTTSPKTKRSSDIET